MPAIIGFPIQPFLSGVCSTPFFPEPPQQMSFARRRRDRSRSRSGSPRRDRPGIHDVTWRDMTWHDVTWCDLSFAPVQPRSRWELDPGALHRTADDAESSIQYNRYIWRESALFIQFWPDLSEFQWSSSTNTLSALRILTKITSKWEELMNNLLHYGLL